MPLVLPADRPAGTSVCRTDQRRLGASMTWAKRRFPRATRRPRGRGTLPAPLAEPRVAVVDESWGGDRVRLSARTHGPRSLPRDHGDRPLTTNRGGIMITVIWIATLISVLGSIELLARSAATKPTA